MAFDAPKHARPSYYNWIGFGRSFAAIRNQAMTVPNEQEKEPLEPTAETVGAERPPGAASQGLSVGPPERNAILREAAERLSAALFHVVHQPTSKGRDRSLAALVALIYGPTPFGGVNSLRDVAMRYGMTEQNLFQLMRTHRDLLARTADPEYEI
jgi:hypothetical protein